MKRRTTKKLAEFAAGYFFPFACFDCRKSFKRAYSANHFERTCPHCGGRAVMMDRKFKSPRVDDVKQWRKVQALFESGFRFGSVRRHEEDGTYSTAKYPEKLSEVKAFVAEFRPGEPAGFREFSSLPQKMRLRGSNE